MIDKVKPFLIIIAFLFVFNPHVYGQEEQEFGQEKFNISVGFGSPELFNIGLRYQLDQVQLGLSMGTLQSKNTSAYSILADVRCHFGGSSKLSNRRPWYFRTGLNYMQSDTKQVFGKYVNLLGRFGREFNISSKVGIEI